MTGGLLLLLISNSLPDQGRPVLEDGKVCLRSVFCTGGLCDHLVGVPDSHAEHDEVDNPDDGDWYEAPVGKIHKHQAIKLSEGKLSRKEFEG